jgi:hypothetical protein
MRTDLIEKPDIVWSIALDPQEATSVRRTAAFVLGEVSATLARPDQLLLLLSDPDDQTKVFALKSAARHRDADVYRAVQNLASTSPDIHVRLAAIEAIGESPFADKNDYLTKTIGQEQTSVATTFSEGSLIKRAAIASIDASDSETYAAIEQIALDANEDPGVRRRALLKCAQSPRADTAAMLMNLLKSAQPDDALVIKACVQGLQILNDPVGLQAIHSKLATTEDPQIRGMISQLLLKPQQQKE